VSSYLDPEDSDEEDSDDLPRLLVRGWFWLIVGCVLFGTPLLFWEPTRLLGLDALVTAGGFLLAGALGAALLADLDRPTSFDLQATSENHPSDRR
jgi:hypothetical protein